MKEIQDIPAETKYVKNKSVLSSEIDGEIIMMSIENSEYYGLDPIGSRIWQLLDNPVTIKTLVETLMNEYDVDALQCENDVIEFLSDLLKRNVILLIE